MIATGCYPQPTPSRWRDSGVRLVGGNDLKRDLVARVRAACGSGRGRSTVESGPLSRAALTGVSAIGRTRHVVKIQEAATAAPTAWCPTRAARRAVAPWLRWSRKCDASRMPGFARCAHWHLHRPYGRIRPRGEAGRVCRRSGCGSRIEARAHQLHRAVDVDRELIALVARVRRFCAHFHLPLQSGDDGLRRRMSSGNERAVC